MERLSVYLASGSPRRRTLLIEHAIEPIVVRSGVDDAALRAGEVDPEVWTVALAYLKARAGMLALRAMQPDPIHPALVLGADTVVVKEREIIGQPRCRGDAERILLKLRDGEHRVVTGVALVMEGERHLLCDSAVVRVGHISDEAIGAYLASGDWQGKAGAYNLSERIEAGWPIEYEGDPTTVMGLPMLRLVPMLREMLQSESQLAGGGA